MLESYHTHDLLLECGCDEAGRGCLAGDVYAAAVVWPKELNHPLLKDSKKLNASQRKGLREFIEENALSFSVATASVEEIGQINILKASILAMHRAIDGLSLQPGRLLIDGNRFSPHPSNIPHHCIIKGDNRYCSIAAASILAKTYRDEYMEQLALLYPHYGWEVNKGYPTAEHRAAIAQYGVTPLHRPGFRLLPEMPPSSQTANKKA